MFVGYFLGYTWPSMFVHIVFQGISTLDHPRNYGGELLPSDLGGKGSIENIDSIYDFGIYDQESSL